MGHELAAWSRARIDEQTALLRALVEIESPSSDPAGVAVLAERLVQELQPLGLTCELLPVDGGGPLLRARSAPLDARPVMLLGHLDTVWPLGTLRARPVRVVNEGGDDGERLFGPGAYDMKAGLVVMVFALRALREYGALPPVSVFLTPLEEVGCAAYRDVMEAEMRASRACLDFEPAWPGGAVKTARKGSGTFTLRARGRAAHAGADLDKGANAVVDLARRVLEVAALTDRERGTSANVGVIRGGIRPNVVPDFAEAEVDVRYARLADGPPLEAALRALRADTPGVTLEVEGGLGYPPLERTPRVARLFETAREVARALGQDLREVATGGASEASFAAALDLPTLDGLGADGDGAHAEHEHVRLASLPRRIALAAALVERLGAE
jgi:glutamate carboxypeptidase